MQITTLVENTSCNHDLSPQHGLSLLIESGEKKILFDTGQDDRFAQNAEKLDIDLVEVDFAVLSHGHYDHGGGLRTFLNLNYKASVYMSRLADAQLYRKGRGEARYIGIDGALTAEFPGRFYLLHESLHVDERMSLIIGISKQFPMPAGNEAMYVKEGNSWIPDDFRHELILVIREAGGLALFTGCGHSGILNMIQTVQRHFPDEKIKAVVGGFHLVGPPPERIMAEDRESVAALGRALLSEHIPLILTGHCTGDSAYQILKPILQDRLHALSTGLVFEV